MSESSNGSEQDVPPSATSSDVILVKRSIVIAGLQYSEYRQALRYDFFYSCAYCTMSEAEATAIRFAIDHYEPRNARPDLENAYDNLMYSCDECNLRKGDRCPPPDARANNYRFFRRDHDCFGHHFKQVGIRLEHISNIGFYTIQALDLNRQSLQRLRGIRQRLTICDEYVAEGVMALKRFHIDRLPHNVKGRALHAIKQVVTIADQLPSEIDTLLREYARSPLIDLDAEADANAKDRLAQLQGLQVLYPGSWRAPRKKAKK